MKLEIFQGILGDKIYELNERGFLALRSYGMSF